jgi:hypothetical protein
LPDYICRSHCPQWWDALHRELLSSSRGCGTIEAGALSIDLQLLCGVDETSIEILL